MAYPGVPREPHLHWLGGVDARLVVGRIRDQFVMTFGVCSRS